MKSKVMPVIEMDNPPAGAIPATIEQLEKLGISAEDIAKGEKRGKHDVRYPWGITISYKAIVETSRYQKDGFKFRTYAAFYPERTLSRPVESGYHLEGYVSLGGKKRSAFTSSQLFQLPDGRLVNVATIHARGE
jgi:hypothetical protein